MIITLSTEDLRRALAELPGGGELPSDEELEAFAERRAVRNARPPVPEGLAGNRQRKAA